MKPPHERTVEDWEAHYTPLVAAGAKFMDENYARSVAGTAFASASEFGWAGRIKPDELLMSECTKCVLGQLYERYRQGADKLGIWLTKGDKDKTVYLLEEYGFDAKPGEASEESYTGLKNCWLREIKKRVENNGHELHDK